MVRLLFASGVIATSLLLGCRAPVGSERGGDAPPTQAAAASGHEATRVMMRASNGWAGVTLKEKREGILIESVIYFSDGLRIQGQVCRPDDADPHPVVLRNHGGFLGLAGDDGDAFCRTLAAAGYVVASSSYRGEDGSEGHVEACLGEVDDVEAMMDALAAQPYVQRDRFAAIGASHGGCITLELALRRPTLKAAVDFFGFGDMTSLFGFWQRQLQEGEPAPCPAGREATCQATHAMLLDFVVGVADGAPAARSMAYENRSPATRLGELQVPLMIQQGTSDYVVDVEQACAKRAALEAAGKAVDAVYVDTQLMPTNIDVCGGGRTLDGAASTQLVVFEGEGHGFSGPAAAYGWGAALTFLLSRL
jgi:dipeptidyl aminopeptidase/acylaminoacyl peptidase